jgi:uncharacterized membrane protein
MEPSWRSPRIWVDCAGGDTHVVDTRGVVRLGKGALAAPCRRRSMTIEHVAALVSTGLDLAGIAALVIGAVLAFLFAGKILVGTKDAAAAYRGLRRNLGKAILVGLELLVAADIIRSVAIAPSFATVGVLGIVVVIRTFLSWSLQLEVSGRWP